MAINTTTSAPASSRAQTPKADRFLNVSIPRADGTLCKLGYFPFSITNQDHADVIAALDANEKVNIEMLRAALVFTYNDGEKNASGTAGIFAKAAKKAA